ncbi:hypothetical protein D3C72_1742900 [compost metagenome]
MDFTSPSTTPRKSTGAPGVRPRSDWLKYISSVCEGPSGSFMAALSSCASTKAVFSLASGPMASSGAWKAMPPSRMVASDCVRSVKPLALSCASMPLACQKRVFMPTNLSYGAFTNTRSVTPRPSPSSS